jgi:hypothetical protein
VRSSTRTWRRQPRHLQRSLPTSGTTTSGNGMCTRSARVSSRSAGPRRPTGRAPAITNTQLQTGHQDIRNHFFDATAATTDHIAAMPTVSSQARFNVPRQDILQRFQCARTRMATISSDIRQYFRVGSFLYWNIIIIRVPHFATDPLMHWLPLGRKRVSFPIVH